MPFIFSDLVTFLVHLRIEGSPTDNVLGRHIENEKLKRSLLAAKRLTRRSEGGAQLDSSSADEEEPWSRSVGGEEPGAYVEREGVQEQAARMQRLELEREALLSRVALLEHSAGQSSAPGARGRGLRGAVGAGAVQVAKRHYDEAMQTLAAMRTGGPPPSPGQDERSSPRSLRGSPGPASGPAHAASPWGPNLLSRPPPEPLSQRLVDVSSVRFTA